MKPTVHHTVRTTTDHRPISGSVSQPTSGRPNAVRIPLNSPKSPENSHCQISTTVATGSRNGAKYTNRQNHCPPTPVCTSSAITSARSTSGIVLPTVNSTVTHSVRQTSGSENSRA